MNKIELIPLKILDDNKKLTSYVKKTAHELGLQFGWHYILDIVWILSQIEEIKLPKGSLILDAGAGDGIIQFCLSRLGYSIISVDFEDRNPPINIIKNFEIIKKSDQKIGFNHLYLNHKRNSLRKLYTFVLPMIQEIIRFGIRPVTKTNRPIITYYKADLQNMKLIQSETIDAIISVSVMEHNSAQEVQVIMKELSRVLKNNAPLFITTSASGRDDWFHKPSHGWAYSERTLNELFLFSDNNYLSNYGLYDQWMEKLRKSEELKTSLSPTYFKSGDNGMPWGIWDPQYYPVGIVYIKS